MICERSVPWIHDVLGAGASVCDSWLRKLPVSAAAYLSDESELKPQRPSASAATQREDGDKAVHPSN